MNRRRRVLLVVSEDKTCEENVLVDHDAETNQETGRFDDANKLRLMLSPNFYQLSNWRRCRFFMGFLVVGTLFVWCVDVLPNDSRNKVLKSMHKSDAKVGKSTIKSPASSPSLEAAGITQLQQRPIVECIISTPNSQLQDEPSDTITANGTIRIMVYSDLSPIAARAFVELVQAGYFDDVYIFRVLKGFVAQWGVRHTYDDDPKRLPRPVQDRDGITNRTLSNVRGTLSFAGGNPATQQVFVNLNDNTRLDKEGSRPFASVDEAGMEILQHLYMGYQDGQGQIVTLNQAKMKYGQQAATTQASADQYILKQFPRWSKVTKCQLLHSQQVQ
ncbi:peptidyl-prolyl cis-trans isomerase B [Nitzschia inconspicua]|nr:peptidyl-prolyl cis-trans isomerase B [Nitzschia inconspicua]